MIKTLKYALQPVINDVGITWSVPDGYSVSQIPSTTPLIFSGDRMVLFGLLQGQSQERDTEVQEGCVTLKGTLECGDQKGNIEHSIEFQIERKINESNGFSPKLTIHRLAAKSFVQEKQDQLDDFEQDCKEKEDIVKISKASNVVSKLTSFVAVDNESREPVTAAMESRPVSQMNCAFGRMLPGRGMYDPTIEDSYCVGGQEEFSYLAKGKSANIEIRNQRRAKKSLSTKFSFRSKKKESHSSKEKSDSEAAAVSPEKATRSEKKGGVKGFFRRLSFRKKKGNSLSSEKAANKTQTGEDQMTEASSFQRAEEEQKDEKPTTSPSTVTKESLMEIISLQKASGAWEMTEQLAQLCGSTEAELKRACPDTTQVTKDDGKVWATALALVLLAGRFNDKKDEWEMVGKKGKKWFKGKLVDQAEYKNMIAVAAKTLNVTEPQDLQLD